MSGHAAPWEYWRWNFAERFGWSLEYIDGLKLSDLHEFFQVDDGRQRVADEQRERATAKTKWRKR